MLEPSGRELVPEMAIPKEPMLRKSSQPSISCQQFEIKREAYIITQSDETEPKLVQKVLSCPAREAWRKAMEEEMESMQKNQVWNLVDFHTDGLHKILQFHMARPS